MLGGNKANVRKLSHREKFIALWIIFIIIRTKITLIKIKFENAVILIN